jgi:hypothetical protein
MRWGGEGGVGALAILFAFVLFGLTFSSCSSCKACNKKIEDPENGTAAKPVEEPNNSSDANSTDGSKGSPDGASSVKSENGTAAKPVEEPNNSSDANSTDGSKGSPDGASSVKSDDEKKDEKIVVEARRLALETKAVAENVRAVKNKPLTKETKANWGVYVKAINEKIQEMTQVADRAKVLEAQAIELDLQRNPQRNLIVIERVARTTLWVRFARRDVALAEKDRFIKITILGREGIGKPLTQEQISELARAEAKATEVDVCRVYREANETLKAACKTWNDADKARADAGLGHEDGDSNDDVC